MNALKRKKIMITIWQDKFQAIQW